MNRKGIHSINRSITNGSINIPNLLLAGEIIGTGKSRVLYGMVYKLLAKESRRKKIFISVTVK